MFYGIKEVIYDESFNAMVVYYNMTDTGSGIATIDFGLGRTKHDVEVRKYVEKVLDDRLRENMMFGEFAVDLPDGVPTWIRLRAKDRGQCLNVCVYFDTWGYTDLFHYHNISLSYHIIIITIHYHIISLS